MPALHPEAGEFAAMLEIFAAGFPASFPEWACIKGVNPHLDWPHQQTVGTHIDVSHETAAPSGLEVKAIGELIAASGRKPVFSVKAHDDADVISRGLHVHFIADREHFDAKAGKKKAGHNP